MTQTKTKYKDKTNTTIMTALHRHYLQVKKKNNYISHVTMTVKTMLTAMTKTVKKMLFCQGLDMSLCDYDGRTALHLAAAEGQFACVEVDNYDHDDNYCYCNC